MMAHKTLFPIMLTALTCLFYQAPVNSSVYKWIDDKGLTHYSDRPNKPSAEEFNLRQNTTTKRRALKSNDAKDGNNTEAKNSDGAIPEVKSKPVKVSQTEKRKLCKQAKSDVSTIATRGRMREINAKGEYAYLSDSQRQQRLATAKKKKSKYCG